MAEDMKPQEVPESEQKPAAAGEGAGLAMTDYGGEAAARISDAAGHMTSYIGRLAEAARAEAAVGPIQHANGHTVMPLATISVQAGFGLGFGGGGGNDARAQGGGSGGGGGGGGRGASRIIAIADVSENGVEIRPVVDVTTLALAGMALVGLAMLGRRGGMMRGRLLGMLRRT